MTQAMGCQGRKRGHGRETQVILPAAASDDLGRSLGHTQRLSNLAIAEAASPDRTFRSDGRKHELDSDWDGTVMNASVTTNGATSKIVLTMSTAIAGDRF